MPNLRWVRMDAACYQEIALAPHPSFPFLIFLVFEPNLTAQNFRCSVTDKRHAIEKEITLMIRWKEKL